MARRSLGLVEVTAALRWRLLLPRILRAMPGDPLSSRPPLRRATRTLIAALLVFGVVVPSVIIRELIEGAMGSGPLVDLGWIAVPMAAAATSCTPSRCSPDDGQDVHSPKTPSHDDCARTGCNHVKVATPHCSCPPPRSPPRSRPNARHPHQSRHPMAATLQRRLDHLRRRGQSAGKADVTSKATETRCPKAALADKIS